MVHPAPPIIKFNSDCEMKTLIVYCENSIFKYPYLAESHTYICTEEGLLIVSTRDLVTGNEKECAVFRTWNYYLIEKVADE